MREHRAVTVLLSIQFCSLFLLACCLCYLVLWQYWIVSRAQSEQAGCCCSYFFLLEELHMALCDHTEYISLSGLVLDTGSCRLQLNKHLYGMFFCVFMACIFNLFIHMELGCNCFCTCHKKPSTIILMVSFNVFCNPFPQDSSQFLEGEVETEILFQM